MKTKKFLALLLVAILTLSICACGGTDTQKDDSQDEAQNNEVQQNEEQNNEEEQQNEELNNEEEQNGQSEEPDIVGGYTEEAREASETEVEVFNKAVADTEYSGYTLVNVLGTQVVAGTNYKFLCKDADGAEKLMVVYADLEGNCSVTSVEDYVG